MLTSTTQEMRFVPANDFGAVKSSIREETCVLPNMMAILKQ
jgi:hypothetical protein